MLANDIYCPRHIRAANTGESYASRVLQNFRREMCEMRAQRGRWGLGEKGQRKGLSSGLLRLRRLLASAVDRRTIRPLGRPIALQSALSRRR